MNFKHVVAIVRPDVLTAPEGALRDLGIRGMTVIKVRGMGEHDGVDFLSRDHLSDYLKMEFYVEVPKADALIRTIMEVARSDLPGAGIVADKPVEWFSRVPKGDNTLPDVLASRGRTGGLHAASYGMGP